MVRNTFLSVAPLICVQIKGKGTLYPIHSIEYCRLYRGLGKYGRPEASSNDNELTLSQLMNGP